MNYSLDIVSIGNSDMSRIVNIIGREIIDSRGNPTVESEVYIKNGNHALASVPSGSSTGSKEARELRDNDSCRFFGKGVKKAVNAINGTIRAALLNMDVLNQNDIDMTMINLDETNNKSRLGANSILSVSLAVAKTAASFMRIPLYEYISRLYGNSCQYLIPIPMMNIVNGGKHADNNLDIQEFMIIPIGAKSVKEAVQMGSEISYSLKLVLNSRGISATLGDEGGFAPNLGSHADALELIQESIIKSNYILGKDVMLALDCAASELFDLSTSKYNIKSENLLLSTGEFTDYLLSLIYRYPIISIEDSHSEYDWDGFSHFTNMIGSKIQLVGDDVFVTNPALLQAGVEKKIANSILIKPNQIGSLTETLNVIKMAKKSGYNTIISHRSGETEDTTIVDIAVGTCAGQIKTGPVRCVDRTSKYNRLIRIEEQLGNDNIFFHTESIKKFF